MNEISLVSSMIFFKKKHLFSLDICRSHSLFINTKKDKIFGCTYFEDIKTSNKLFRVFSTIIIVGNYNTRKFLGQGSFLEIRAL